MTSLYFKDNGKLRVAIIGAGHWGPNIIRNFSSNLKCEVVCVADTNQARLDLLKDRYSTVFLTTDVNAVVTNPTVDAVVICTPTSTHFEISKKALENGKHVFVEKPLASTAEECTKLVTLAKAKSRLLFVGHIFVYNAGIQAARDFIKSGELGKILYVHINRTNLGPIRTDVNALWDLAPHDISILNYFMDSYPSSVSAVGGRFLNKNVDDVVFATYSYPNGVLANIHVSWLNPKKVREIVIVGDEKMMVWDDMDLVNPIKLYDRKVVMKQVEQNASVLADSFMAFRATIQEGDIRIPKIKLNEPLAAECAAFLKAIEDPTTSLSDGIAGAAVVDVLVATDLSMAEGGTKKEIHYHSMKTLNNKLDLESSQVRL